MLNWLSNCNGGKAFPQGGKSPNDLAKDNILGALGDSEINGAIGEFELVWGPYTQNSEKQILVERYWVTDNLLFLVRQKDIENGALTYVVATAGTNVVSSFGWFYEDMGVSNTRYWPTEYEGSQIAEGSMEGLDILINLPSSEEGMTKALAEDIQQQKNDEFTSIHIYVAGHSLGGALSPLFAIHLEETKSDWAGSYAGNTIVFARPTAGPGPGNSNYTSGVNSSSIDYLPMWNKYDMVPHGWKNSMLESVSGLFKVFNIDGGIIVDGMIKWAKALSPNSSLYDQIQCQNPFSGSHFNFSQEIKIKLWGVSFEGTFESVLEQVSEFIMKGGVLTDSIRKNLETIAHSINSSHALNKDDVCSFLKFMVEAGYQHTSPYLDYFFDNDSNFIDALKKYVHFDNNYAVRVLDTDNFTEVIKDVASGLSQGK